MSLTPERWQAVQRLFGLARELPAGEREAFVRSEAGSDTVIAAEVLRLLRAEPEPSFLVPPEQPEGPAPRRLGDFELLQELGRGRFGVVYRARQLSLGRIVAVKVLMPSVTLTPRDVERFAREARAMARLHHPNIGQVLVVGEEHGTRYFVMELIQGPTLADEVKRLRAEQGNPADSSAHLPSSRAGTYFRAVAELTRQVADALSYAHQHGVVHRDVKPSNLILDAEGQVRIVDFGLARDEEQGTITKSDVFAGTPHYMSPEQASGYFHRVDQRTDVYSLGVVLFELLTLSRPFEGRTTYEILRNIRELEAPRIRGLNARVPRDLEVICNKAMARKKDDRYASAAELRDDLQHFLSHEAIRARPPSPLQLAMRSAWRKRYVLVVVAVALLAACGAYYVTRELGERRRISRLVQALVASRAEAPLRELPLSRQLEVRRLVEELRALPLAPVGERYELLLAAEGELAALRDELARRGREGLAQSKDATKPEGERELLRLSALQTLLHAAHLFPQDTELAALSSVESAFPTLAARAQDDAGNALAADVYLREVDVFTSAVGAKRALGPTPLAPTPVLPGYYRVVVVFAAGGFRELICNPGPTFMELELVATRRADESSVTTGMIAFPAGQYTFPEFNAEPLYQGRTVSLDAFWLDATEVSNAQYARFLRATGHELPVYWKDMVTDLDGFLELHGELPVLVSWIDAVAFAEWSGKRLPTAAEWFRSAGGLEGRPFPYSSDPAAPPRGNVLAPAVRPVDKQAQWKSYLQFAAPVGSYPEAATPEGVLNMFGNVLEHTESMAVLMHGSDGAFVPVPYERFDFGGTWDAIASRHEMRQPNLEGFSSHYDDWYTGFRCATSTEP